MRSHLEKHRDMARSILPSRHRLLSRHDLPRARRRTRRLAQAEVREAARWVRGGADGWLDYEGDPRTYDDAVPDLVRHRRQGDKLNHFERWAVMSTLDLPVEQRMVHLRRVLPDTLPGRHALSHLDHLPVLGTAGQRIDWLALRAHRHEERRARRAIEVGRVRAALHDALEHGDQAPLNRALRRTQDDGDAPLPLLRTPSDVEALLASLVDPRSRTRAPRPGAWDRLLRALDECGAGWRHLCPIDGVDPFDVDGPWDVRQSDAAGLSWLPSAAAADAAARGGG